MQDYAYYSTNSGLTPALKFTLDDHYYAWLKVKTGRSSGTINDLESLLYGGQGGQRGYYLGQLVLSDTGQPIGTLQALFFASSGGGSQAAIYGTSTYDSTAVYA